MELTRDSILDTVFTHYERWYDLEKNDESSSPLVATAAYHEHGTGYVLVRKAEMWSADKHEFVWFYSVPHLDMETYNSCLKKTLELGEPMVNPVSGHMSTYLVMVIICDTADDDALAELKKCRIRKSFQFSLKGWMEVHTAAVEVGKSSVTANNAGRATANFLKSVLKPKVKRRFSLFKF